MVRGVYTRPEPITDAAIIAALRDGWGFNASHVAYLPAGFGSHHWIVRAADGARRFLTVDDLTTREFLGGSPPEAFDALSRAFATAHGLEQSGLDWVVGPVVDGDGQVLRWLDQSFSVAVFPYVEGAVAAEYASEAERSDVVARLVELHQCTEPVAERARRETFAVPNRADLEAAMASVSTPWTAGPYAEPARALLAEHIGDVRERFADYDRLVARALAHQGEWTITHGEPHSGNVLRTGAGLRVIDWDTVLIAPQERDLWMLVANPSDTHAQSYTAATGRAVQPHLLRLYALWWELCEIAIYVSEFHTPHADTEDSAVSWRSLRHYLHGS
jgi:spectinomycin phosphotransferase